MAEFYRLFPCRRAGRVDWMGNANAGFRRSLLEEVGPFRSAPRLAEDTDFLLRARARGRRPYFEPRAAVTHDTPRNRPGEV
ncbi:glycosyltransferase, partial [Hydrogenophaga sp.]|uniref:glycosyltransferase n=1 Tax=Hydrogenophaga sp. TaxID=1904254 RepID=UPI0025C4517D